jgi:ketosteroid isomerase-like protein
VSIFRRVVRRGSETGRIDGLRLAVAHVGRQRSSLRRSTVETLDNPVLQVLDDYKAAVLAQDVDAFVSLYDPDLSVFDMWGVWSYDGIGPWRDMVAGWFGSLGTDRVIVDFSDTQVVSGQDVCVLHTFMKFKAIDPAGVELRSMDNRLTMTLRRAGEAWKIVHQHSSCPVDPKTIAVMFKR